MKQEKKVRSQVILIAGKNAQGGCYKGMANGSGIHTVKFGRVSL